MKKFVVFVLLVLMITGCGKKTSGDVKVLLNERNNEYYQQRRCIFL